MKGNMVGLFIGLFIACIVAITVVLPLASSIVTDATTLSNETNESVTFAVNGTYYEVANTPVDSFVALYNDSAHRGTLIEGTAVGRWAHTGDTIKVITNGTGTWPNITNTTYYASYGYQGANYVDSSISQDLLILIPLFILIGLLVFVSKVFGMW